MDNSTIVSPKYASYAISSYDVVKEEKNSKNSSSLSCCDMMNSKYIATCICPCFLLGRLAEKSYVINGQHPNSTCYKSFSFFKECCYAFPLCIICYPISPFLAVYIKNSRLKYEPFDHISAISSMHIKESDIPFYMWPISLNNHYKFLMKPESDVLFKLEMENDTSDEDYTVCSILSSSCCCCFQSHGFRIYQDSNNHDIIINDKTMSKIDLLNKNSPRSSGSSSGKLSSVSSPVRPQTRIESKVFVFGPNRCGKSLFVQKLVSADVNYHEFTHSLPLSSSETAVSASTNMMTKPFSSPFYQYTMKHSQYEEEKDESSQIHDDTLLVPDPDRKDIFTSQQPNDDIKIGVKIVDLTHRSVSIIEAWDIPIECSNTLYMNTFLPQANVLVFLFDAAELDEVTLKNPSFERARGLYEELVHNGKSFFKSKKNSNTNNISTKNTNTNSNMILKTTPQIYLIATKHDLFYNKLSLPSTHTNNNEEELNNIHNHNANIMAHRKVNLETAKEWATGENIHFVEVSALHNEGIIQLRKSFMNAVLVPSSSSSSSSA